MSPERAHALHRVGALTHHQEADMTKEAPVLTPHRVRIMRLVANGRTRQQISTELCVSTHTIKTTMEVIFARLGAADRAHAVAICFALGLLHPEDITPTIIVPPGPRGWLPREVRT